MIEEPRIYSDNTRVKQSRHGAEFLSVGLCEPRDGMPYTAYLSRYCVPGRCDTYHFDLSDGSRIRYSAETLSPLPEALMMLHADLEKDAVVELVNSIIRDSLGWRFWRARDLVKLLENLAPQSRSCKAARKEFAKLNAERRRIIEQRRQERKEPIL